MSDFSFDFDNGDVLYHYGDGFACGSDGTQYMEIGDGLVVDLDSNEVHFSPHGQNAQMFCSAGTRKPATAKQSEVSVLWRVMTVLFALLAVLFIVFSPMEKGQMVWSPGVFWLFVLAAIVSHTIAQATRK